MYLEYQVYPTTKLQCDIDIAFLLGVTSSSSASESSTVTAQPLSLAAGGCITRRVRLFGCRSRTLILICGVRDALAAGCEKSAESTTSNTALPPRPRTVKETLPQRVGAFTAQALPDPRTTAAVRLLEHSGHGRGRSAVGACLGIRVASATSAAARCQRAAWHSSC